MGIYRARMRRTSKGRRDPQRLTVEGDSLFLNLESEGREANTPQRVAAWGRGSAGAMGLQRTQLLSKTHEQKSGVVGASVYHFSTLRADAGGSL